MHIMICVSGWSGTGKDEFCKRLVTGYSATQTGLADPAKRHMADLYGFTEEQLFGPSKCRNAGDLRYMKNIGREIGLAPYSGTLPSKDDGLYGVLDPSARWWAFSNRGPYVNKSNGYSVDLRSLTENAPYLPGLRGEATIFIKEGDPAFWLSPREALQKYCELMNDMYLDTWIRKGVEDQRRLATGTHIYSRMGGMIKVSGEEIYAKSEFISCFSDFRHIHEFAYVRSLRGKEDGFVPIFVRIRSERVPTPPYQHRSEVEQTKIPDSDFDFVVHNDGTVQGLHDAADLVVLAVRSGRPRRGSGGSMERIRCK